MHLSRRVALENIIAEWPHMSELEKNLWTLRIFLMFDKRARVIYVVVLLAVLAFVAAAIIADLPAPVFLSIGFVAGVIFVVTLAIAILTSIKRR